ncbi:MAG: guanylate kinase [Planctomycetaceae bacterium]|nr:guanylate kinase [Planctomycetaceae bacterium]
MRDVSAVNDVQIVVLSGPSGSGKSTIVRELLLKSPIKLTLSVSATTRPRRQGEVDGRDYYFLSQEEFQKRLARGDFLECAEVHSTGNWYGTLKSELDRAKADGTWALLEIDVQGAKTILEQFPNAISIFLWTSDFEKRLRDRATETEEVIQKRVATAKSELEHASMYAYKVLNDKLPVAVQEIIEILQQHQRQAADRPIETSATT